MNFVDLLEKMRRPAQQPERAIGCFCCQDSGFILDSAIQIAQEARILPDGHPIYQWDRRQHDYASGVPLKCNNCDAFLNRYGGSQSVINGCDSRTFSDWDCRKIHNHELERFRAAIAN